jgi:hypothetical protein
LLAVVVVDIKQLKDPELGELVVLVLLVVVLMLVRVMLLLVLELPQEKTQDLVGVLVAQVLVLVDPVVPVLSSSHILPK